mmetsp:Transcript_79955/g.129586  ORF Transcript_79955/g.129586 Transcript_79955/m.129586 type:complete len:84 (-) Transcript_79955:49-300(-)
MRREDLDAHAKVDIAKRSSIDFETRVCIADIHQASAVTLACPTHTSIAAALHISPLCIRLLLNPTSECPLFGQVSTDSRRVAL